MSTFAEPYTSTSDIRDDAKCLRRATNLSVVHEVHARIVATESVRRGDVDPDYADLSESLVQIERVLTADELDSDHLSYIADLMVSAADDLDLIPSNVAPKRERKAKEEEPEKHYPETDLRILGHDHTERAAKQEGQGHA